MFKFSFNAIIVNNYLRPLIGGNEIFLSMNFLMNFYKWLYSHLIARNLFYFIFKRRRFSKILLAFCNIFAQFGSLRCRYHGNLPIVNSLHRYFTWLLNPTSKNSRSSINCINIIYCIFESRYRSVQAAYRLVYGSKRH